MVQMGKVLSVEGDMATVEIVRESACSSCHGKDSCGASAFSCAKAESVQVPARNLCGASVGDTVELSSDSFKTVGIAFSVFVLPILIGFLSYFVFNSIFDGSTLSYIVAVLAFVFSFFLLFLRIDKILSRKINVDITRIIKSNSYTQENPF